MIILLILTFVQIKHAGMVNHIKDYFRGLLLPPFTILVFSLFFSYAITLYALLAFVSLFSYRLSRFYSIYSLSLALSIDQLANASTHGNIDQTVSGRLGYAINYLNKDYFIFVTICKILNKFFRQSNHCKDAIEFDRL